MKQNDFYLISGFGLAALLAGCSGYKPAASHGPSKSCLETQGDCVIDTVDTPERAPRAPAPGAPAPAAPTIANNPPADPNFRVGSDGVAAARANYENCQANPCTPGTPEYQDWQWFGGIAPGPVSRLNAVVYWIERPSGSGNLVNPEVVNGCYRVRVGDRITVDMNQKNAAGQESQWTEDPIWMVALNEADWDEVPNDGQPFLFRIKPKAQGKDAFLYTTIEGVRSENTLCLTTK